MEKIFICLKDGEIYILGNTFVEKIFNINEYKQFFNCTNIDKYNFFKKKYTLEKENKNNIKREDIISFNFILLNNIANYLMDKLTTEDYEIIFYDTNNYLNKDIIKLTGILKVSEVFLSIYNILKNYSKDSLEKLKKSNKDMSVKIENIKNIELEKLFFYKDKITVSLKEKLEEDLIAFKYVERDKKNDVGRYELPVYIDKNSFIEKGLESVDNYLSNWESIAYLKMIMKIHENFAQYYDLPHSSNLTIDSLTICLLDLLDSKILPYPEGLKKSLEIGRATSGKCYFVESIPVPISLSIDMMLMLQAKDLYSVVTRISKYNKS